MIIVLTGIDGSGKSTLARAIARSVQARGGRALLLGNHAGRRTMSVLAAKTGLRLSPRAADTVETLFRVFNVLVSHVRASRFRGVVVMDRHLHCQLALRAVRGLPYGRLLPWLLSALPRPTAVVHVEIDPVEAHRRIMARGTDSETLADLLAFRDAYAALPQFPGFIAVDGSQPAADLAEHVLEMLNGNNGVPLLLRQRGAVINEN